MNNTTDYINGEKFALTAITSISDVLAKIKVNDDKVALLTDSVFNVNPDDDSVAKKTSIVKIVEKINKGLVKQKKVDFRNMYLNYHRGFMNGDIPIAFFVDQFSEFFIIAVDPKGDWLNHISETIESIRGDGVYSGGPFFKDIVLLKK